MTTPDTQHRDPEPGPARPGDATYRDLPSVGVIAYPER